MKRMSNNIHFVRSINPRQIQVAQLGTKPILKFFGTDTRCFAFHSTQHMFDVSVPHTTPSHNTTLHAHLPMSKMYLAQLQKNLTPSYFHLQSHPGAIALLVYVYKFGSCLSLPMHAASLTLHAAHQPRVWMKADC